MRVPSPTSAADRRALALDAWLRRLVSRRDVAHAVMAVERGDESFRWTGAEGEAAPGGPPMRPGTPYFIASIDKLFNAIIAMRLVEQDQLRLDEPVATYLPDSVWRGLHRGRGTDRSGEITVRHLLTHTSGLADWLEDRPKGRRSLVERLEADGDLAISLDEIAAYVRDRLVPHFPPQDFESPRVRVRYSDTNFVLLSAIIERVAARPLHEVHTALLYEPLAMHHTWMAGHSQPADAAPEPAALWFGDHAVEIPLMMRSIQGVYSTAADQVRLLRAFVRGELFDRPDTLTRMQQWRRFGLPLDAAALRGPNWPIEYGFGLMRFAVPRWLPPFRPAPSVIGHTGSTGTWLFHCPARDLLLAGSVDQVTAGPLPFRTLPGLLKRLP